MRNENLHHRAVRVAALPKCDFCGKPAKVDGKTSIGPWANMCWECYGRYGIGLGEGMGQQLLTANEVFEDDEIE